MQIASHADKAGVSSMDWGTKEERAAEKFSKKVLLCAEMHCFVPCSTSFSRVPLPPYLVIFICAVSFDVLFSLERFSFVSLFSDKNHTLLLFPTPSLVTFLIFCPIAVLNYNLYVLLSPLILVAV